MNVSAVTTALKKFSGKPLSVVSKAIGAVSAASVIYDMHVHGKESALSTDRIETGNISYNNYREYMQMDSDSAVTAKAKKVWYDMKNAPAVYHPILLAGGYIKGAVNRFINVLPIAVLSVLALKCKGLGKVAGVLLAGHAVKSVLFDVIGLGRKGRSK